jgi:predicted CxxxxCH...CXXCH cytochrome family protein
MSAATLRTFREITMTPSRHASLIVLALVAAAGCGKSRGTAGEAGTVTMPQADGTPVTVDTQFCVRCHGDLANATDATTDARGIAFAPPKDLSGATTGAKVGAHMAHLKASTLRGEGVPCSSCHVIPQTATQHTPGVNFGGLATTVWAGAPAITPNWDGATGSCASTYCHGAFPGGTTASLAWTSTATLGCTSCHGFPPAAPHPFNTTCETCHQGYDSAAPSVNLTDHMNGVINGGCSGCHGTSGRTPGGIAGVTYDANLDAAPPVDHAGQASSILVGVHLAHVNPTPSTAGGAQPTGGVFKPILCSECHPSASAPTHQNGSPNVTFVAATTANLPPVTSPSEIPSSGGTAATCSTYCHNGAPDASGTRSSWTGAAATCGSCHGFPPASHSATLTTSNQCSPCHSGTVKADGTIDIAGGLHIDGTVESTGCTGCHGTDGRANGDMAAFPYDANQAAAPPVDTAGSSTSILVGAHLSHVNPSLASGVYKPIACTECHPDNTTGTHPGGGLQLTFTNAIAADLALFVPIPTSSIGATAASCTTYCHNGPNAAGYGGTAAAWSWTAGPATCASCHGDPPATAGHVGLNAATNCGGCHPGYTATTVDLPTHINGQLDGGESIGGQDCGGCHTTIFSAMNGTVAKSSKHSLGSVAGTNDSPTDSGVTWGSPLSGNAATSRSCVNMCHGDHPHDLTNPVVATHENNAYLESTSSATRGGATRTSATRAKTDFVVGETNGGLCTSCHRNPITAGGPTVSVASYGASAHDFTTFTAGTTWNWQYVLHSGAFDRNCTKCHASNTEGRTPQATATSSGANSVHYNSNPTLLAGSLTLSAAVTDLVCYNCHGSTATPAAGAQGNRSGKNIQAQFAKTNAHIGAGVTCLSCHDSHRAKAGTHATPGNLAGPPLEGVAGAQLTGTVAFWTAPTAGSFTAKTIVAGSDVEATLCFKCHSAFGTLPAGTTDTAKEFNPGNTGNFAGTWAAGETAGGFHPVLAAAGSNLGAVKLTNLVTTNQAWSTTTRNTMTCTDCHESNSAADPNGPHGSTAGFILKGPNTAWSASIVLGSSIPAGTFCLNCHQSTFTNSRFTSHSRSDHFIPCFNCHAAVPHGGPRPGMLVAGAGANANVGGTIAGWDTTSPYWQGTATDRLYLVSYPTSNASSWTQGNCGCNGTGH